MKAWLGIVVILLILAVLNPSKDDYESYIKNLIENVNTNPDIQNSPLSNALKSVSVAIIMANTTRNNYYIFSTYSTTIFNYKITRYGFIGNIYGKNTAKPPIQTFWQQMSGPFGSDVERSVNCLTVNSSGDIFAATIGGVYRSTDNGNSWTGVGLASNAVSSLAINSSGDIFAGTYNTPSHSGGLYRSTDNGNSWTGVGSISYSALSLAITSSGNIFAGTADGGFYRSTDNGNSWTGVGLTTNYIFSLAINSSGDIFAATIGGVYRSTDNGNSWTGVGLATDYVSSLAINSSGDIFAGTIAGVYRSADNGNSWTEVGLSNKRVHSLAINSSGDIFAGTKDGGFYRYHYKDKAKLPVVIIIISSLLLGVGLFFTVHRFRKKKLALS